MLKSELDNLIAPCESTLEEFELLEKAYMSNDYSTKEDVAAAWKLLFKKNHDRELTEPEIYACYEAFDKTQSTSTSARVRGWVLHIERLCTLHGLDHPANITVYKIGRNFKHEKVAKYFCTRHCMHEVVD